MGYMQLSHNHQVFQWNTEHDVIYPPTKRPPGTSVNKSCRDGWSVEKYTVPTTFRRNVWFGSDNLIAPV